MPRRFLTPLISLLLAVAAQGVAFADTPRYLDDRSDAATLVRSFYNAVNRQEFSRAWDYFGDTKPAADFAAFAEGFETTDRVDVLTGATSGEGAAGSQFYIVPVAIMATSRSGGEKVYAGCYTARLVDPQIQEPPFRALHIEKAQMSPSDRALNDALPASCGDGPPAEPWDAGLETARRMFEAAHADDCDVLTPDEAVAPPDVTDIAFRTASSAEGDPDSHARLFRFLCSPGAYNEMHVYYLEQDSAGVAELHFAIPELDVHYAGNDTAGKVEHVGIVGYTTEASLANSSYDAATSSITSFSKWRGPGDASSSGTWLFRNGAFTLVKFDVDASYDGEVNPETVLDYNSAP